MEPIRTLFTAGPSHAGALLPEGLRTKYDGEFSFPDVPEDRPYVVANFVSTIDGVVTFNIPGHSEGSQVSVQNEGDRFIMGLLRASADAIVIGSSTVEATDTRALWLAEAIYPPARDLYREYRKHVLKKPEHALIVIISGSGSLDLGRAVFQTPSVRVLIITSARGKQNLAEKGSEALQLVEVKTLRDADGRIAPSAILKLLREEYGARLVLHEGGPTLLGQFFTEAVIDELFLTIAPQVAGRVPEHPRPGLVSHAEFLPSNAPWMKLVSAKQSQDYLYLRYRSTPKSR